MPDNKSTFITRVISALLAAAVVFSLGYFGGYQGSQFSVAVVILLAIREYSRMVFPHCQMPAAAAWLFRATSLLLFVALYNHFELLLLGRSDIISSDLTAIEFALANVAFLTGGLWIARGKVSNENILASQAFATFGMLYCVLFPFFAIRLLTLPQGLQWFFFLLLVVFFGDTFAYFGGRWFGRRKLMTQVSPNKTWEGAVSGLAGSSFAGVFYATSAFEGATWIKTLVFCIVCGMVAQSGDLIISLVKRVAQVKDSGTIMPGHGGILDRLDGVFIASPLVYAFALYVTPP